MGVHKKNLIKLSNVKPDPTHVSDSDKDKPKEVKKDDTKRFTKKT
jgi:hypothetical protein